MLWLMLSISLASISGMAVKYAAELDKKEREEMQKKANRRNTNIDVR